MPRMIELIRTGAVPLAMKRAAAYGSLSLPLPEMLEILVELRNDPDVGQQAQLTLAKCDDTSMAKVCQDPATPASVLEYFFFARSSNPEILQAVASNTSLPEQYLRQTASKGTSHVLSILLDSERVRASQVLLRDILTNPHASDVQVMTAHRWLGLFSSEEPERDSASDEDNAAVEEFLQQFKDDLAAEEGAPFELVLGAPDEEDELRDLAALIPVAVPVTSPSPVLPKPVESAEKENTGGSLAAAALGKSEKSKERLSLLQRIAAMTVGERVKLAMRGSREERIVLIRDRSKVVSLAVLESPKVNESEMEAFAAMKNVQENVLRAIASKRRFLKHYSVIRALVNNPKVPIDAGMPLVNHMLNVDLRFLARNRNVNENIRKLATNLLVKRSQHQG